MNNFQLELINKIVSEKKEIEFLKEKLKQVEKSYHDDLIKLYDSVNIFGIEKEVSRETKIISMNEYKNKKLFKGKLIDKD